MVKFYDTWVKGSKRAVLLELSIRVKFTELKSVSDRVLLSTVLLRLRRLGK